GGAPGGLQHLPVALPAPLHDERLARRRQPRAPDVVQLERREEGLVAELRLCLGEVLEGLGVDEHHRSLPLHRRDGGGLPAPGLAAQPPSWGRPSRAPPGPASPRARRRASRTRPSCPGRPARTGAPWRSAPCPCRSRRSPWTAVRARTGPGTGATRRRTP